MKTQRYWQKDASMIQRPDPDVTPQFLEQQEYRLVASGSSQSVPCVKELEMLLLYSRSHHAEITHASSKNYKAMRE